MHSCRTLGRSFKKETESSGIWRSGWRSWKRRSGISHHCSLNVWVCVCVYCRMHYRFVSTRPLIATSWISSNILQMKLKAPHFPVRIRCCLMCCRSALALWGGFTPVTSFCVQNREMHDHMEYFLAGQDPPPLKSTENKPQVIYRWTGTSWFLPLRMFSVHMLERCDVSTYPSNPLILTASNSHHQHTATRPCLSSKSLRSNPERNDQRGSIAARPVQPFCIRSNALCK